MKYAKMVLLVTFFFNCYVLGFAQWESMGSGIRSGQSNFFSLSAVNEQVIWAVPIKTDFTASFDCTRTVDGGTSWQEGTLPATMGDYYPGNVFALNAQIAWVIMINLPEQNRIKIFKTVDGGTSWIEQRGGFNEAGHAFAALHFFNAREGVGFGSPGTGNPGVDSLQIFRTADGGENWQRIPPHDMPAPLAGEGVWLYSGNGTYEVQGDTIWFVTRAGRVFRSIDRGGSWEAFRVGISGSNNFPGLASIAFENAQRGLAVTFQPNKASKTTDGGQTWTEIPIPADPRLGAIEFVPGTANTYLIHDGYHGSTQMLLTTDGGLSWTKVAYPPSMHCIQFLSPTVGFGGGAVNPSDDLGLYKWTGNLSDSSTRKFNKQ